jgi:phosphoribosylamine--glycine ligase
MRVLVVGSGAREHALADAMRRGGSVTDLHAAPGNPGIAALATCHEVAAADVDGIVRLAAVIAPDLVVVGPEAPLVEGLGDALRAGGFPTFGPGRDAARLEGSKAFAKDVMRAAGVPTAEGLTVTTLAGARDAIAALGGRVVVKADGLAAGKGVIVCDGATEAEAAAGELLGRAEGTTLVIEERLDGYEVSLLALCDGLRAVPLEPAQDFKRIGDDDTGPNTGGMGAYSPVPGIDADAAAQLVERVHVPVLRELARRGIHFTGCLYAGLMMTADGPRVLEFNVRFGDPEAEALLVRIEEDLALRLHGAATGMLAERPIDFAPGAAVTVVLASRGYPASAESGVPITGIAAAEAAGARVYHAGTARHGDEVVTAGGRVLAVTATGADLGSARESAYAAARLIAFDGMQSRSDIAAAAARLPSRTSGSLHGP